MPNNANVAVIGASGGIGRAFVDALRDDPGVFSIYAFSRAPGKISGGVINRGYVDVTVESSIADAAAVAADNSPLDLVVVATGILHEGDDLQPEKKLQDISPDALLRVFQLNAAGPALVAKHFLPHLRRGSKTVFAALSARVGSIADNRLGGWASYRASKAALNMLLKTISIEHARRWPDSVVAGLHPGTVSTRLSAPFSDRVPEAGLFTPQPSAGYLIDVIEQLQPADSGNVFAWDGQRIEY